MSGETSTPGLRPPKRYVTISTRVEDSPRRCHPKALPRTVTATDPADPTPAFGGPLFGMSGKRGPVDNRKLESRHDVLLYTTPPLESDLEVIGVMRLELYVRSSLEHTDFFGRLCDVEPSGRSINVSDGLLRVSPGNPESEADGTLRLRIELWPTAHSFEQGHCLRLAGLKRRTPALEPQPRYWRAYSHGHHDAYRRSDRLP